MSRARISVDVVLSRATKADIERITATVAKEFADKLGVAQMPISKEDAEAMVRECMTRLEVSRQTRRVFEEAGEQMVRTVRSTMHLPARGQRQARMRNAENVFRDAIKSSIETDPGTSAEELHKVIAGLREMFEDSVGKLAAANIRELMHALEKVMAHLEATVADGETEYTATKARGPAIAETKRADQRVADGRMETMQ